MENTNALFFMKKFYKYYSNLLTAIDEIIPDKKAKMEEYLSKHFEIYKAELKALMSLEAVHKMDKLSLDNTVYESEFTKFISSFWKLVEFADFRQASVNPKITIESISNGIELNADKDFYILIKNEFRFLKLWSYSTPEEKQKLADIIDGAFVHAQNFVKYYGFEKFEDIQPPHIQFDNKLDGKGYMVKLVLKEAIKSNLKIVELEKNYKKNVIKTSKIIVDEVIGQMTDAGIKSEDDINLENMVSNSNFKNAITNSSEALKNQIESGVLKKDHMVDITSSVLGVLKDSDEIKKNRELKIMLNSMTYAMNQKAKSDPSIKSNPYAQRIIDDMNSAFGDEDLEVDHAFLAKMDKNNNLEATKARLQEKLKQNRKKKDTSK